MTSGIANKYLTYQDAGSTGFWRGVATGAALCAALFVAAAILFPPLVYAPPVLEPETSVAPDEIGTPAEGARAPAAPPRAGPLVFEAPSPIISALPPRDTPPGLEILRLPAAPDIFDGGAAGSPSLFDPEAETGDTPELR